MIGAQIWHQFLRASVGTHAGTKRFPPFWVALSNEHLATLLRAYFEGDGGVEKGGVLSISLNRELTADVAEALLRFGIWARVRSVTKRKPNGDLGNYWKLTVSGTDNVRRYADQIAFLSARKTEALRALLGHGDGNTNVDLVYGVGARLRAERLHSGLLQRDVAAKAGCHRAMIGLIETGDRNPSRDLFVRICAALGITDTGFTGLANVHWSTHHANRVGTCPHAMGFMTSA